MTTLAAPPELKQDAELVAGIPGVGEVTVTVFAYASDGRRFASAKAWAALGRIWPAEAEYLGEGSHHDERTGHADLRRVYVWPGGASPQSALRDVCDRLNSAGLRPRLWWGAVMLKLAHVIYGEIKSGTPLTQNSVSRAFQEGTDPVVLALHEVRIVGRVNSAELLGIDIG